MNRQKILAWGLIGYSIILGILILTKCVEGNTGAVLFMCGLIVTMGIRKRWLKDKP